jgi:ribonuclease M5
MMKTDKLKIPQAVIVEGKCDRAVLESVIDATIIAVNGFGVFKMFKDIKKLSLIRMYAQISGIIILTDSDNAGRQIRDFIKRELQDCCEIYHVYVPNLYEVEDTDRSVLRDAFEKFNSQSKAENSELEFTRRRLYDDGFIGGENSAAKRKALLKAMNLPENLSVTALLDVLNKCNNFNYEEYIK